MSSIELKPEILSRRTKFIYGLGDWGTSAASAARNIYWLFFLISVVGLQAQYAGVVILIGRVWDSINDPMVGMLSDRLNTKWGRRRPFFLYGAVPFGLSFFLLFLVPPIESQFWLIVYYGVVYLLFDTMYTVLNVPYSALTPELTEDYDERSSLVGWRIGTAILAGLVAGASFRYLAEEVFGRWFSQFTDVTTAIQAGYALVAALAGLTFIIPPLILFVAIREREGDRIVRAPIRPWHTFKEVFSNRPFRITSAVYLLSFTTSDVVVSVFVWFLVFYVRVEPPFDAYIIAVVLGIGFASMPLTVKLMRTYGKRNTYIMSMTLYAVVLMILSQVPPEGQTYVLIAAIFAGFGYGATNVIPWAMVADVIEEDELKSGERREGIYSGYLVFFRKLATAISIAGVTWLLAQTGFRGGTTGGLVYIEQPESALLALRLLVGVIPAFMVVLSILVVWRYPIDRTRHAAIRRELAQRRTAQVDGELAGIDPALKFQLYVVGKQGPRSIAIPESISSIHDVLTGWPIGAYTVFRTYQHNRFLSLDDHLGRLVQPTSQPAWDDNLPRSELRKAIHTVCSDYPYPDAQVRIDLLVKADPRTMSESKVLITLAPFEPPSEGAYRNGVVVGTTSQLSRRDPAVKSAEFVIQRRQYLSEHPEVYEVLLLDGEGFVKEGASSNLYGVRDGELWTANDGILPGTTRQIILEIASGLEIGICHDAIHQDDIHLLDEAAISSSSRGIVPVVQIDGLIIGSGRPGKVISQLMSAYRNYVTQAVKPAVESAG